MSRLPVPDFDEIQEEAQKFSLILKDKDDLSCVLIATALLEQALGALLERFFISGTTTARDILDPTRNGFLSDLIKRSQLCYCLGLITKRVYSNLLVIAGIRNRFAHSHLPMDFSDMIVIGNTRKLILSDFVKSYWRISEDSTPRYIFSSCALAIVATVSVVGDHSTHRPKPVGTDMVWNS
jgi:DNA-binding MltR family transcriptional regulator